MSALLDGECSDKELDHVLAEFERDPALREQFSRQILAREAREGTRLRATNFDFPAKVLAALQDERPGAVVVPLKSRVRQLPWKAATGLAAAAAVGAMAVLAIKPDFPAPTSAPAMVTAVAPGPAVAMP
ncbi:MAG: sigma-E factor negative regulatory protein, partial [Panacagrimonas sp.]